MAMLRGVVAGLALMGAAAVSSAPASAQYNWSGMYFGGHAGLISTDIDWAFNPAIPGAVHQAYSLGKDEGIIGGHAGIQHQFGGIVVGVEAGYSGTGSFGNGWMNERGFGNNNAFDSQTRIDSILQAGARLGWAPSTKWMLYVSGGYASAQIHSRAVNVTTGAVDFDDAKRHDGWYLGAGLDYALTSNWIVGLEYQRMEFDTARHCPGGPCLGALGAFVDRDIDAVSDVIRARLSFKLGRPEPAMEAMK